MAVYRLTTISLLFVLALVAGFIGIRRSVLPTAAATPPAEIRVNAPLAAQPLNVPFAASDELTRFTPGGLVDTWGGYSVQIAYDPSIIKVDAVTRGICSNAGWALVQTVPTILTGCAFQSSTAIGILENLSFECIANGSSLLHLKTFAEADVQGTFMFDENGVEIDTNLIDATVTCGAPTATGTASNTPTFTPSPTFTATPTPMPTSTPTPGTAICSTNVGGPPTLGSGLDCDTDPRFGGVLGDGCVDSEDADPHNPWDFYSVPVPALLFDPNAHRNSVVDAVDAQAVFRYFIAGAATGTQAYEQDLNHNGVKDGWEYDRSESPTGVLGPPDGVISARDAQTAFGQFKLGKSCTSGYNLSEPLCTTNVGGPPTLGVGRDCDYDPAFPGVLGDGCVDSEDANVNDPWGFYSVPVPALFVNPNGHRNNIVSSVDGQAVFAYFRAGAVAGSTLYDQDLNHNGVRDGWEYDRTVFGGGVLGPPDGVISASDAEAAFAQFKLGLSCSSGYDLKNTAP